MLILHTDRDSLLKPLQTVTGIVERKHTLPILANVLIESIAGNTKILATDLEIQIHTQGPQSESDFRLTTNAKKLQDILNALPEGAMVQLEWLDNNRLVLKAGKSRFNLQTLPAEDFPTIKVETNTQTAFDIDAESFKNLISQVQYSMAFKDARYYLNGILMQVEADQLRLVATDGNRLSYAAMTINANLPRSDVILPSKTVVELRKILNQSKEIVSIEWLDNQVRFICNDVVIISKVIDGKFPDYNRVIPMNNNKIFLVERMALLGALERSAILANEKYRGVRMTLSAGSLKISCSNNEQEEAQEELEIAYTGETLEISFNIAFLMDMLRNINSDDIQIAFGDATHSALFTLPHDSNFKYIVMPMRI